VWMGDDAAWVEAHGSRLLATVDAVVEGVHADLSLVGLDDFGWRAVSTAVSDIAAMGGAADQILVSVAGPPGTDLGLLYEGIRDASCHHGTSVVGGELSTSPALVVVVTVLGHLARGTTPVLRSGAKPKDAVLVTGPLGAAAAGLRLLRAGVAQPDGDETKAIEAHKRPVARLAEGQAARESGATAMIDLSDGLAADVRRIAEASRVGIRLESVPVAPKATEHEAICGGDDYELLVCTPDPERLAACFEDRGLRPPEVIGECTEDPSETSLRGAYLPECGWEHPFEIPGERG
jgi:thiamine-monophosphate kinase